MGKFREHLELIEALRIVKKATEVNKEENKDIIGKYKNNEIIRTSHTKDSRKSSKRDANLTNDDYMNIIKKVFTELKNGYNSVIYKNKNDKYDNIILQKESGKVRVITVIQHNRDEPTYHAKPSDNKIISEMYDIIKDFNLIILD